MKILKMLFSIVALLLFFPIIFIIGVIIFIEFLPFVIMSSIFISYSILGLTLGSILLSIVLGMLLYNIGRAISYNVMSATSSFKDKIGGKI